MKSYAKFVKQGAIFAAICAATLALPLFADIDPNDYAFSFNVKFAGYAGSTTLTNFPALIRLSEARNDFKYSACKLADGADTRFYDADGNLLPSEVDTWNPDGESLVWVCVPELNKDTVITVCYGNAAAPAVTPTDVWTNGYVAVWHMNAAEGSRSQRDSTASGKTVTCPASYADGVQSGVGGKIGLAARCGLRADNYGGYGISDSGYFDGFGEITVEAWTFRDSDAETLSVAGTIIEKSRRSSNWAYVWSMYEQANSEKIGFWLYSDQNSEGKWLTAPDAVPAKGEWHYHARRWSGTTGVNSRTLDADSFSSGSAPETPDTLKTVSDGILCIGNSTTLALENNSLNTPFHGDIDEVRISSVARSGDWIKASYDTVATAGFVSYEAQNDWPQYSHKFTMSFPGVAEGTTLENFPVLVKISETGIPGFRYADCEKEGGADLRFTDGNGTSPLPCEVESWDPNGTSFIWVKVPTLTKDTRITGYYGWNLAPAVDATDVWDEHYSAVWHMGAASGSRSQKDSTSNGKTVICPATYSDAVQSGVEGAVGLAARCGLRSDNLGGFEIADSGYFDGYGEITIEAWTFRDVGAEKPSVNGTIVEKSRYTGSWLQGWSVYEQANGEKVGCYYYSEKYSGGKWMAAPTDTPAQGEWHYHARRWSGTTGVLARTLDATTDTSGGLATVPDTLRTVADGTLCIGNRSSNVNGTTPFHGDIDEVRISKVARSDAWVKATHDTIANNSSFTTYGEAQEQIKGLLIIVR